MSPTETLKQEHRVIEIVLSCLDRLSSACSEGKPLDTQSASEAVDFFKVFADRCHHGKEEDLLFPMMESKGFSPEHGPTGVMRHEHELGRRSIQGMTEAIRDFSAGKSEAQQRFAEHAKSYSELLRQHIQKEDHCLFQMADQTLTPAEKEELSRGFARIETEHVGEGIHERYLELAHALAKRLGVTAGPTLQVATGGGCCSHPPHAPQA